MFQFDFILKKDYFERLLLRNIVLNFVVESLTYIQSNYWSPHNVFS